VIEFNSDKLKALRDEIAAAHGFKPLSHQFHIFGLSAEGATKVGEDGGVEQVSRARRMSPR